MGKTYRLAIKCMNAIIENAKPKLGTLSLLKPEGILFHLSVLSRRQLPPKQFRDALISHGCENLPLWNSNFGNIYKVTKFHEMTWQRRMRRSRFSTSQLQIAVLCRNERSLRSTYLRISVITWTSTSRKIPNTSGTAKHRLFLLVLLTCTCER